MSQNVFSSKLAVGIIVALFVGVALFLRIALPYDQVFSGGWIKFTGVDAYHYMHLVDNLVHNFPHLISFDPYLSYPYGLPLGGQNFFVYLLGGITWVVGLGSPTQHTVDIVSVYFPAIVGALTVIPVYFIGKALFNRWAGVLSAGLVTILPSEFLGRSILGFTDRDAVQVLFTTLTMLFLILAIKSARQKQLAFNHLKRWDWAVLAKPLVYSLLTGILLGIYLLTWIGALLFVVIIFIYLIIQYIIDHFSHKSTDYLCFTSTITFFVILIMLLPTSPDKIYLASLVVALFTPLVLSGISRLMIKRRIKPAYYPLTLIGLGVVGLVIFYVINPSLLSAMLGSLGRIFAQPATELTITESQPILFPAGDFSFSAVWGNFTTSFFLGLISLGMLIYLVIKRREADKTLFLVWSLVILVVTLAMRRFALFFTLNVALLAGYLCWLIFEFAGFKEIVVEPVETSKKAKEKAKQRKTQKDGFRLNTSHILYLAFMIVIAFFLAFFPNIAPAVAVASQAPSTPSDGWVESLSWLKDNTPDPFGNPDFYYGPCECSFNYPKTAYGVMAWWDYGYQIIRTGHRIPNCTPGGGSREEVGRFFTAQDEASANKIINNLQSKYVIIDHDTVTGMFYAMATYAGSSREDFSDIYYEQKGSMMVPVQFFYPEYYRSFAVRLYNFDSGEVIPRSSTVISYEEKVRQDGMRYKEVMSTQSFPSYEEAEAYVLSQESGNYKIVSDNQFISPVPLKALEHYQLIHGSDSRIVQVGAGTLPEVKIFEYTQ